ncbi:MAG: DUF4881 domain-containing protein [Desulfobulbus sp.]|jgi:hypothetical protein
MNWKNILLPISLGIALAAAGCTSEYGKVEQGRAIAFDKEKQEVTVIHDSAMDPQHPVYDVFPAAVFKLPTDPKEIGPLPNVGQRLQIDAKNNKIVIYDLQEDKIVDVPIVISDLQQPISKDHPLVYDAAAQKQKKFPQIDAAKKTITVYSSRQKLLCTFTAPDQYFAYPESTWVAGDEVRIYYKVDGQALRFMNITQTNIYKR